MTFPGPPGGVAPYVAYPAPIAPPPGFGCLVTTANHGPYIVSAASTTTLKVDGREFPIGWCLVLPPGRHDIKLTDFIGIPMIRTELVVHPGATHPLRFHFGGWRNRVYDGQGTDVTRFGMWSNYAILLLVLGPLLLVALLACVGILVLGGQ